MLNGRLDKVFADVHDLKTSQTFQGDDFKDKHKVICSNVQTIKEELTNMKKIQAQTYMDTKGLIEKNIELEDRHRRNNIRIDGVPENLKENWEETAEKVKSLIKHKIKINDNIEIERAHRVGRRDNNKPRTIVCKLLRFNDKTKIQRNLKNLKDSGVYVNDDFSEETARLRQDLFRQQKIHRDNGKFAKVVYNRLVVQEFKDSGNGRLQENYEQKDN